MWLIISEKKSLNQFHMEICRIEHWSTRTLDDKIDEQLFERTAISRKPDKVIKAEL